MFLRDAFYAPPPNHPHASTWRTLLVFLDEEVCV